MNKLTRRLVTAVTVPAAVAAGLIATAGEAQAADYNGVCGSDYHVIDSLPLDGGTVYLTYNRSNGSNCVVTVRDNPGTPIEVTASIRKMGDRWWDDVGWYTTYAGPVTVSAAGTCIDWGGGIGSSTNYQRNSHCG